jgi:hypothetical protein
VPASIFSRQDVQNGEREDGRSNGALGDCRRPLGLRRGRAERVIAAGPSPNSMFLLRFRPPETFGARVTGIRPSSSTGSCRDALVESSLDSASGRRQRGGRLAQRGGEVARFAGIHAGRRHPCGASPLPCTADTATRRVGEECPTEGAEFLGCYREVILQFGYLRVGLWSAEQPRTNPARHRAYGRIVDIADRIESVAASASGMGPNEHQRPTSTIIRRRAPDAHRADGGMRGQNLRLIASQASPAS